MDFALYVRVLWRFRLLVLLGLLLAVTLAVLSLVSIGTNGVNYRQSELFASNTRLLVTQTGFPEGRLYGQVQTDVTQSGPSVVDPGRFNNLAVLYSQLAESDAVRLRMLRDGPIRGEIIATPVVAGGEFKTQLPMIDLTAIATTPGRAVRLARRSANALSTYIRDQQRASHVPVADRAVIQPVVRPGKVELFQPRSKTMPIVVFVAVMFVTVGLVFILENLRPRLREAGTPAQAALEGAMPTQRRTA
jgi:hypothetical protein